MTLSLDMLEQRVQRIKERMSAGQVSIWHLPYAMISEYLDAIGRLIGWTLVTKKY